MPHDERRQPIVELIWRFRSLNSKFTTQKQLKINVVKRAEIPNYTELRHFQDFQGVL